MVIPCYPTRSLEKRGETYGGRYESNLGRMIGNGFSHLLLRIEREREVDIVANVGLVVEFLGVFTNMAALGDHFFPFCCGKERIFRMTHVWELEFKPANSKTKVSVC